MKIKKLLWMTSLLFTWSCQPSNKEANKVTTTLDFIEQHRPNFHFTPPSAWMNDPNGMVYYEGEYHLFYQHYPDSTVWGPMHWGHAVSKDMVHWKHLPIALYPDSLGYIFSGSAVIDWTNSTGFSNDTIPPMVAIYTYHDPVGERSNQIDFQTQGIAYSLDKGRTWTKYQGNPVIKNPGIKDFRDPKVMWSEDYQKWIMALAVKDHVSIYSSSNLIDWKFESDFGKLLGAHGGVWECPDIFKMKIKGSDEEKWVLLVSINPGAPNGGSATQYFVGNFDGTNFISETDTTLWLDYGKDNYAGVTWSDIPEEDGRRLFIGWMSNWQYANVVPTENWRSATTIARKLELEKLNEQFIVTSMPVEEMDLICQEKSFAFSDQVQGVKKLYQGSDLSSSIIDIELEANNDFKFELSNELGEYIIFGFDKDDNAYYVDRTHSGKDAFSKEFSGVHFAPRLINSIEFKLKLVIDNASIEIFADEGKTVMTDIFFPNKEYEVINVTSEEAVFLESVTLTPIKKQLESK